MSAVEKEQPEAANTKFAKDQLKAFVERIERLEEEKKTYLRRHSRRLRGIKGQWF